MSDTLSCKAETTLAVHGGSPVRDNMLPYARQSVSQEDIQAVAEALASDFLTTGPQVAAFEKDFALFTGSKEAVAVSSGTAALHCAMFAIGIEPGDEVIVPAMTFVSTANAVLMQGGTPVIADVEPGTLLIDLADVERKITEKTKAVIAVDYTGQPCDYDELRALCTAHHLILVADACHAIGAHYKGRPVGTLADLSTFSFHPTKPITTGEGGIITTDNAQWAESMRRFRNHGMSKSAQSRQNEDTWLFDIESLGYNYRLGDAQCALGREQIKRLPEMMRRRRQIAQRYDEAFATINSVAPLMQKDDRSNGYHLYVVLFDTDRLKTDRAEIFRALRSEGIGVNVHYIPVHMHGHLRKKLGTKEGMCPVAEDAYSRMVTLPLFAGMTDDDADDVIKAVEKVCSHYS